MNRVVLLCATVGLVTGCNSEEPRAVLVLAASSTKDAVEEAASVFQRDTGIEVKVSTGPSNFLAEQVLAGSPGDLFLSASEEWSRKVVEAGHAEAATPFLGNALVIVVPSGNPASVHGPMDLLKVEAEHVALAGEKVPAGKYAEQALRAASVFEPLRDGKRIVYGQDVRTTLGYVELGEAEAGVVYATDARLSEKVEVVHTFEASAHDTIVYPLTLLKRDPPNKGAVKFHAFLLSEEGRAIFHRFGFTDPRKP